MKVRHILRVTLITGLILLVPLVLQLTIGSGIDGQGFNWKLNDFVFMGGLIFIAGLLIDVARRKMGKNRLIAIGVIVVLFLWLWAELAVGVFTNWGS
ncbi:MAG: hypothetical protein COV34_01685 [Candidatus Zambryskibacteria bacterium CG10_big_fil_rev_8_21_14_0_10_42_12]|uniref:Uncharacterized protein n=1 Tax=Candidatus Zambryskibacteria bacterium CG10_big_fil_rev_8_21_14_0_10_42_12 TaxID=1975115 RepID=A0A2H0QVJ1_9BACT|nr:MAG: hypothetical protein COV34_01685 [Candidatus Zambryskibacteria bacterium CG10_big_fil_rev_8_21_14_0_10_42_12]